MQSIAENNPEVLGLATLINGSICKKRTFLITPFASKVVPEAKNWTTPTTYTDVYMNTQNPKKANGNKEAHYGWKRELQDIINEHAHIRINGNVASNRTKEKIAQVLFGEFNTLHTKLGLKVMPRNFGGKHLEALCKNWYYDRKLAPKTMRDYFSVFRIYCGWLKKAGMANDIHQYLPEIPKQKLEVAFVAKESKSLAHKGIDIAQKIKEAKALDMRFGCILQCMIIFGLRLKDALYFKPTISDHGTYVKIFPNESKGSRPRNIDIMGEGARAVLDEVKAKIGPKECLGWVDDYGRPMDLKKNRSKYYRLMKKIGLTKNDAGATGHSIRAEYAENLAMQLGLLPGTLGGTTDQMPKEEIDLIRARVSENLGHSRLSITGNYYGKLQKPPINE